MAETEKITINMNVVDLGKIDLLVARGFFSSRTDFIRAAIRDLAAHYDEDLRRDVIYKSAGLGAFNITRKELEEIRATGGQKEFSVIGLLTIDSDVTPDLALATIHLLHVYGVLHASEAVKIALGDRIK